MTPERWQQVKTTLAEALERDDTNSRAALLDERCAEDPELRREVESLLEQPADAFESYAESGGLLQAEHAGSSNAGRRIGAYELVRELGRGGMGTVWLATRADREFQKEVAIKLLKRGTDTDEVLRRFRAEREILARLEHPNIARLLDGGTTDDGLPYFVMEYVAGTKLTDYCSAQRLTVADRLRLFLKVCSAVQFAHQNLVIHRDLKPANILVTAEGEPKLLDFGIAKLVASDESMIEVTAVDRQRLTPGYASPEQVRAEPITTVSDVYALGAILYELLTGKSPHQFATRTPSPTELLRVITEKEPPRPSLAADDRELRRQLRGDLETIVLTALRKEPQLRYRGVGAFADDLRRYLDHWPIRARPATLAYRAGKFLRRNKVPVAAAFLLVLALIGGAISTLWQARRAERRFNDVRKIANSFLFEFHDAIRDLPGALAARQLVTQRAVQYLDSLAQEAGSDRSLKSELAAAYDRVGDITFHIREAFETHRKAAALNESLLASDPTNNTWRRALSHSYSHIADLLKIAGRSTEAVAHAQKAVSLVETVAAEDHSTELQAELSLRYDQLAITFLEAGASEAALEAARKALVAQEKVCAARPGDKAALLALAVSLARVHDASEELGDRAVVAEYGGRHFAVVSGLFASDPTNARFRRAMWSGHLRDGGDRQLAGDLAGARAAYEEAVRLMESLSQADPSDTGHRRWLAVTYSKLAGLLVQSGEAQQARELYEKAAAIAEALSAADAERAETRKDLVEIYRGLGALLAQQGDSDAALETLRRAQALGHRLLELDPPNPKIRSSVEEVEAAIAQTETHFSRTR